MGRTSIEDSTEHGAAGRGAAGHAAEDRFRALVDRMPAIVYVEVDDEAGTTYMSPRIRDVLGHDADRFLRDPGFRFEIMHPDDRAKLRRDDGLLAPDQGGHASEYRLRDTNGDYRWFRDEAVDLVDESGVGYRQGVLLEISEQKRVELELRETAAKLQTLIEQIPAVVYIEGADGSADSPYFISARYEELFGYTAEERVADPKLWVKLLHPEDREHTIAEARRAAESGRPFSMDYRMVARDGRTVWVHDETRLIRDEEGRPQFWQGVLFDITERKRGEEELRQALDLERRAVDHLRQADELKNTFLTAVSHDLRAPLAAILGAAVTLEQEQRLALSEDDRRDLIRGLADKARRLTSLVSDLLDMERLTEGVLEPRRTLADVAAVVEAVVRGSDLGNGRVVHLETEPAPADVDASMVERIVENLLMNAAKHTPSDSTVWVRVEAEPTAVLIVVEDDGPGVPPELRDKLFLPFERGSGASAGGVGLGLSLVSRFAELHGGRAWVEDRDGGGASFRVRLGLQPA